MKEVGWKTTYCRPVAGEGEVSVKIDGVGVENAQRLIQLCAIDLANMKLSVSEVFNAIDKWEKEWSVKKLFMEGLESCEVDEIMEDLKKTILGRLV